MRARQFYLTLAMALCVAPGCDSRRAPGDGSPAQRATITYPIDGAVFPPDIAAPTVRWTGQGRSWTLRVEFAEVDGPVEATVEGTHWTPTDAQWAIIKQRTTSRPARLRVGEASVSFSTSADPVGAPLFYREVILPFADAVKDPSRLRWRFGTIDSAAAPPVVLENLPVCGNCHSFSADGRTLGMDVDYANDKGSYAIAAVERQTTLSRDRVITWSDYRRSDGELTFGLLSQVSPDGRYVVSTVKDRSIFMVKPDLAFSQLFFPIKGILAIYDRQTRQFAALPGADDRAHVQTNASWSPDGQHLYFARGVAEDLKDLKHPESALVTEAEAAGFFARRPRYTYDICRIAFNGGRGGKAEPLVGASGDGMSNYFPRCSPDGRWVVFCKSRNYMLLQADSELYIVPAEGGVARRMRCNTARMNSWHSFSPNGRWLVFSSKANGPYTQLWLTHIDDNGQDSPPVVLDRMTAPDRAANIPEFVNAAPDAIARVREQFMDDLNYVRAGMDRLKGGDLAGAAQAFGQAIAHSPKNAVAHYRLGSLLARDGRLAEAAEHFRQAAALDPAEAQYAYDLGRALRDLRRPPEAEAALRRAIAARSGFGEAEAELGRVLFDQGRLDEAITLLREATKHSPDDAAAHFSLAMALYHAGDKREGTRSAERAREKALAAGNVAHAHKIEAILRAWRAQE